MMFNLFKDFVGGFIVNKNTSEEYNVTDCNPLLDEIEAQIEKNSDLIYQHKVWFAEKFPKKKSFI